MDGMPLSSLREEPMRQFLLLSAGLVLAAAGCETTLPERLPGIAQLRPTEDELQKEEECRVKFQTDRDPESLDWLMDHCLNAGVSVEDVNALFGTEGERLENDRWVKAKSRYREDDETWQWGPDNQGRSIYLVFREGRLIYNPKERETAEIPE